MRFARREPVGRPAVSAGPVPTTGCDRLHAGATLTTMVPRDTDFDPAAYGERLADVADSPAGAARIRAVRTEELPVLQDWVRFPDGRFPRSR